MNNLQLDSDFVNSEFGSQAGESPQVITLPSGTIYVSAINGISGSITHSGGTSGFTYSAAGSTITIASPLTTKGDIYTRDGTNGTRLAVGGNDARLVADSTATTGLRWQAVSTGWTAWTGTASRATQDSDDTTAASAGYVQAEVQDIADRLRATRRELKALVDDLMTQKVLKT